MKLELKLNSTLNVSRLMYRTQNYFLHLFSFVYHIIIFQGFLPKTLHFKIIDWILLLSVNSQIVIMVFHTYMYWACQDEYNMHRFHSDIKWTLHFLLKILIIQSAVKRTGYVFGSQSHLCFYSYWSLWYLVLLYELHLPSWPYSS